MLLYILSLRCAVFCVLCRCVCSVAFGCVLFCCVLVHAVLLLVVHIVVFVVLFCVVLCNRDSIMDCVCCVLDNHLAQSA